MIDHRWCKNGTPSKSSYHPLYLYVHAWMLCEQIWKPIEKYNTLLAPHFVLVVCSSLQNLQSKQWYPVETYPYTTWIRNPANVSLYNGNVSSWAHTLEYFQWLNHIFYPISHLLENIALYYIFHNLLFHFQLHVYYPYVHKLIKATKN